MQPECMPAIRTCERRAKFAPDNALKRRPQVLAGILRKVAGLQSRTIIIVSAEGQ
jgi:hypothetical protein